MLFSSLDNDTKEKTMYIHLITKILSLYPDGERGIWSQMSIIFPQSSVVLLAAVAFSIGTANITQFNIV